ncbi:bifunctional adenosylcobinamide kinase/adenosylcobinamide-phosphate guanylyltransferase [Planococcus liqunii]|uniref:bifunctional adenosylcobinamide kinase/adenosylcobinamide-phosphate guanylyltransferase n=1 Tax=Planococcus liqunii TaxID=3058394 RepID=UPI0026057153|nr:bifunctional adenosylcobinamide kinase/adenosylcobinamide-phosphate guanylyltransferase [Planococcus sp. N056]WKA50333.1 bifunctional adenosylcobinamide kinase/adenosylcobinamide-phosphate guanylyltransferase [Planococcus sp. N056]
MAAGQLIFVSGGVRSGKSAWAEGLIRETPAQRKVYLASGRANDAEMAERIQRHRDDRKEHGWHTIERPLQLEQAIPEIAPEDAVLWDCVTTWLANELYEGWERGNPCVDRQDCMEQKWAELQKTVEQIRNRSALLVIVSNEVLDDFIRDRTYQQWLGRIHLWLVAQSNRAYEVENGVAYRRK